MDRSACPDDAQRAQEALLVVAARAGDRSACARLIRRWHRPLAAHALRLTGRAEVAEEVTQDAWMEILRGLDRLADPHAFRAWAYRIVSRRAARAVATMVHDRALGAATAAEPPVPAADAPDTQAIGHLRAAIRALPPEQRAAVALYHFEDMPLCEVAVALDCPVGTVKTRLFHARRRLRALLTPEGAT